MEKHHEFHGLGSFLSKFWVWIFLQNQGTPEAKWAQNVTSRDLELEDIIISAITLPKFNIAPEKLPSQ